MYILKVKFDTIDLNFLTFESVFEAMKVHKKALKLTKFTVTAVCHSIFCTSLNFNVPPRVKYHLIFENLHTHNFG